MKLKVVLWLTVGDRMCMDSADVCVDKICFYIRLIAVLPGCECTPQKIIYYSGGLRHGSSDHHSETRGVRSLMTLRLRLYRSSNSCFPNRTIPQLRSAKLFKHIG